MDNGREVVVLSGVRTAIGDYGGGLKDIPPTELAARVVREAVTRARVAPEDVGHVVFGNVIHRVKAFSPRACINGGLPKRRRATLNRLCGSGLQAIVSAAQAIRLGDAEIAVAGGAESMSRGIYADPSARWGARMGDHQIIDMMVGALTDPFDTVHMGITAENVATKWGITRQQQDEMALESNRRAVAAAQKGYFRIKSCRLRSRPARAPSSLTRRASAGRRQPGRVCLTEDRVQARRIGDRGQCFGYQRWGSSIRPHGAEGGREEGVEAVGAAGGLRACRRGSEVHGHRARARCKEGDGTGWSQGRGHGRH